jgi:hypothetical protein
MIFLDITQKASCDPSHDVWMVISSIPNWKSGSEAAIADLETLDRMRNKNGRTLPPLLLGEIDNSKPLGDKDRDCIPKLFLVEDDEMK